MARANYYHAKLLFEQKSYGEAVKYVESAKKYLNGGTNAQLQFLQIMALHSLGNYTGSQYRIKTYHK